MQRLSGYELCRHIRRSGLKIPLVLTSGNEEAGMREVCDFFLAKPISANALKETLANVPEPIRTLGKIQLLSSVWTHRSEDRLSPDVAAWKTCCH